jgi:hypothetical protein
MQIDGEKIEQDNENKKMDFEPDETLAKKYLCINAAIVIDL